MDGEDPQKGDVAAAGRAEIDTRAPFRSVKEAVALFGERVLVGEIYANKLKEIIKAEVKQKEPSFPSRIETLIAELEETKQSLQRCKEESSFMAYCIRSLRGELEEAKRELHKFKAKEHHFQKSRFLGDPEIELEDLKFTENPKKIVIEDNENEVENERGRLISESAKRSVKFTSPPYRFVDELSDRSSPNPVKKSKKKKAFVPVLAWLFAKKKGTQRSESPSTVDAFC